MALVNAPSGGRVGARPRPGVSVVYRWELVKLAAQTRVKWVFLVCFAAPFLFAAGIRLQSSTPQDTLFGRWVHESGYAIPLVVLTFASAWVLPLLTCLVAGDIFSAEDGYGTWKTVLTRSCTRRAIFAGKVLAAASFTVVILGWLALTSLGAGVLVIGHQPLTDLSGSLRPSGELTTLVLTSWATVLPPTLGFTSLGLLLSIASRRSVIGIGAPVLIGIAMQLISLLSGAATLRQALLTTAFDGWHGLLVDHHFYRPLVAGTILSAVYLTVCLGWAYLLFLRRDVRVS